MKKIIYLLFALSCALVSAEIMTFSYDDIIFGQTVIDVLGPLEAFENVYIRDESTPSIYHLTYWSGADSFFEGGIYLNMGYEILNSEIVIAKTIRHNGPSWEDIESVKLYFLKDGNNDPILFMVRREIKPQSILSPTREFISLAKAIDKRMGFGIPPIW